MKKKTWIYLLIAFGTFIFTQIVRYSPDLVQNLYTLKLGKLLVQPLSLLTGILPFSLAELIVILLVLFMPIALVWTLYRRTFIKKLPLLLKSLCVIYIAFVWLWGLNYQSAPAMPFERNPYTVETLYEVAQGLTEEANALRENWSDSLFTINHDNRWILKNAALGYSAVSDTYPVLAGHYGTPKPILLSKPMLYTGITGVYFPFTGEANVNIAVPDLLKPATVLHEMAHQRGIAPEDQANFIAYLTGIHHPDVLYQYSSTVLALIHVNNALYDVAPEKAALVANAYSPALRNDLNHNNAFWKAYEGNIQKATDAVNNTYLKSNQQSEGVKSYGLMVDWIVAYKRQ